MSLIYPVEQLPLQIPGRKPPFGTPLNRSHPLAQKMAGCILLYPGAYFDSVNPGIQGTGVNVASREGCPSFNGSSSYITFGDVDQYDQFLDDWSWVARYKIFSLPGNDGAICGKTLLGALDGRYYFGIVDNVFYAGYENKFGSSATSDVSISSYSTKYPLNNWHMAASAALRGSYHYHYHNGVYVGAASAVPDRLISNNIVCHFGIGAYQNTAGTAFTQFWLDGIVDFVYLYRKALTASEIQSLYIDPYQMFRPSMPYWFWSSLGGTTAPPTTLAPTTVLPTTLAPTTLEPTTLPPTTLAPTTLEPTTLPPTTLAPTTLAPTTLEPTTLPPTTLAPTTLEPTTLAPTTVAPTTLPPTTVAPTTIEPTTLPPTTLEPTTVAPTTLAPTTIEPTTLAPTTVAPTTILPTTIAPTTIVPTSLPPTTIAPTTVGPTTLLTTLGPTTLLTTLGPTTAGPVIVLPWAAPRDAILKRNVANQKVAVYAWDDNGNPVTGDAANITAFISIDGAAAVGLNDLNPVELDAINMPGVYIFDLLQAETDGDLIVIMPESATPNIRLNPLFANTMLSAFAWVRTA